MSRNNLTSNKFRFLSKWSTNNNNNNNNNNEIVSQFSVYPHRERSSGAIENAEQRLIIIIETDTKVYREKMVVRQN